MNNDHHPRQPILLEHEADGIKELDNLLPRWWVWLFYLCIAFSIGYMLYFHVFHLGDLQLAAYAKEQKLGDEIKAASIAKFEASIGSLEPSQEPAIVAKGGHGAQIYQTYCLPCHREDGGGLVGPNLTDTYWIHGSNYVDSVKVILNGVPEKGMLTWRGVLKPNEITAVASYIYTLRGTTPPNPKPPENQPAGPAKPSEFE
jgi:cytochrome c oxidase cbb3-type subunit 3